MFYKLIGESKGIFNIITLMELILSICFIILGLLFFTEVTTSNIFLLTCLFLLFVSSGVISILSYFKRSTVVIYNNNLIYGIILILISIITCFLNKIIIIMLAIYLIINGIQKINYGLFLKKFHEKSWLITLVVGIIFIVIAFIDFFTNKEIMLTISGISLLGFGLINLVNIILLRKRSMCFLI